MDKFFDLDGPVYRVLAKIWGLMVLNLCIILTSLPLVTVGVSLSAAYAVCFKMHEKNDLRVIRNYFSSFKINFKQAIVFSVCHFFLLLLLVIDGWYFVQTFQKITVSMIGVGLTIFFLLLITQYLYAYIARYQDSFKTILTNSMKLSFLNSLTSFVLVGMSVGILVLMVLSSIFFVFVMYISIFIGIAFIIFLKSFLVLNVFKKYETMKEK